MLLRLSSEISRYYLTNPPVQEPKLRETMEMISFR